MIELTLVFLLGMLVAGLIWLVMLPAFWRRAVRLTTERLERSLPISANEILAEQDRLRAEHGVALARMQQTVDRARTDLAAAKAETGERCKAEAGFLEAVALERRRIAVLESDIGGLKIEIETRALRIEELSEALDLAYATIAGLETQRDALTDRLNTTNDLAESRRLALDEARVLADRAREAHAEEAHRSAQLRNELQARQSELREVERRLAGFENNVVLARIRGGEETYQSAATPERQRQAG
jgi:chromosome segregation ATPase